MFSPYCFRIDLYNPQFTTTLLFVLIPHSSKGLDGLVQRLARSTIFVVYTLKYFSHFRNILLHEIILVVIRLLGGSFLIASLLFAAVFLCLPNLSIFVSHAILYGCFQERCSCISGSAWIFKPMCHVCPWHSFLHIRLPLEPPNLLIRHWLGVFFLLPTTHCVLIILI